MFLSDVGNGEHFRVKKVYLKDEIGKRIAEMGFTEGVAGKVLRRALLGDPIEICILHYKVSLRKSEASGIEVEKTEKAFCCSKRRERRGCRHQGECSKDY